MLLILMLFFLFLALKLAGVWALSWLWVTSPLWISAILALVGLITALVFGWGVGNYVKRTGRKWEL